MLFKRQHFSAFQYEYDTIHDSTGNIYLDLTGVSRNQAYLEQLWVLFKKSATHSSRFQLNALVIQIHARNQNGHLPRTFEAENVRFLQFSHNDKRSVTNLRLHLLSHSTTDNTIIHFCCLVKQYLTKSTAIFNFPLNGHFLVILVYVHSSKNRAAGIIIRQMPLTNKQHQRTEGQLRM